MYRNKYYRQKAGGAIGLRLTGVVARIVMDRWAREFLVTLGRAGMDVHMLRKYVDDVNLLLSLVEKGYRWNSDTERLEWSQEADNEDRAQGAKTDRERTFRVVQEIASSIVPGIAFTIDLPEFHPSGRVPMLDVEVWIEPREEAREDKRAGRMPTSLVI